MSDAGIAIVLAHGDLAEALVSAVQLITGRADRLIPLSNRGLGAAEIDALLRTRVQETGASVVFTDMPAGSCSIAAVRMLRERPGLTVVTGVNLPALLHFATCGDAAGGNASAAAAAAAERGGAAVRALTGSPRGD